MATLAILAVLAIRLAAAGTITGTVHNQTTGQVASGDEVVLLGQGEGTKEEARTKTDAQGGFALDVADPSALHVVRVFHQGVNYDQNVSGSDPLEIRVFDAVPKIPGLSGNMGIAQMETAGTVLKVTEMYGITNASSPPVTQSGARSLEISIPTKAVLDSLEVRNEAGSWIKVATAAIAGKKGRYAANAPLRPGDTLFKFTYHLPYAEPTAFHLKLAYPIKNFAVTLPPSMSLKASRPGTFRPPGLANGFQIFAANGPVAKEVPAFVVFGAGAIPPPAVESNATTPPPVSPPPTAASAVPHAGPTPPAQSSGPPSDQSKNEFWLLLSLIVVVLAVGVLAFWRMRGNAARAAAPSKKVKKQMPLLDALKEELFQLESDRLHGSISGEEYAAAKAALHQNIQRATKESGDPRQAGTGPVIGS